MPVRLGLAFGGGGARGLAHIGVLKVLEEQGIPIHCIAGSSIGGLIAAVYAAGMPARQIQDEALRACRLPALARFLDLSIGPRSVLDVSDICDYLADLVGSETQFKDLRFPLALAAVDLGCAQPVALSQGRLLPAILATISLPGLFPAVEMDGQRLVDGGLLNNLPVDLARLLDAQVVAAVDVQLDPFHELPWQAKDDPQPKAIPMPTFFQDVYRSGVIMIAELTRHQVQASKPEIYLRPCLPPSLGVFTSFARPAECIAAGELAARQALPEIRRVIHSPTTL